MTLATCFRFNDGVPYLLGDALISSPVKSSKINIPTNLDITFESTYEGVYIPTRLKQKLIVLSDHLAIGWADSWLDCAAAIREISDKFGTDEVHGSDITKFLESKNKEYPNANLVGITKAENTHYVFYFNGALKCSHPQLTDFFSIGTGSKYFSAFIKKNIFPVTNSHIEKVCAIAGLMGGMLGQEMVDQSTLLNNFGGAFELVHYYGDNTFKKLEQMTYFFWSAHQHKDGLVYLTALPIILKYATDGIGAIVIRLTGKKEECTFEGKIPNYSVENFRLNPVIGSSTESQWKKLEESNLNSPFQCHYIFGKMNNGNVVATCLSTYGGSNCKITKEKTDIIISNADEIGQIISKEVHRLYRE